MKAYKREQSVADRAIWSLEAERNEHYAATVPTSVMVGGPSGRC